MNGASGFLHCDDISGLVSDQPVEFRTICQFALVGMISRLNVSTGIQYVRQQFFRAMINDCFQIGPQLFSHASELVAGSTGLVKNAFSFFWVARKFPPSFPSKPKSKPIESSPYSPPSVWANALLFIWARISVGRVFSFALRTLRPPLFFLPVIISGGGRALTFWAFGGSQAFSILLSMSSRND